MSEENVEVVRRIYAAWGKGSPADSGLLHSGIEWINPPDAVEPGTRTGVDAFTTAVGAIDDMFEIYEFDLERLIDQGQRVVVTATIKGRGRGSGAPFDRRHGSVWTIRDGRAVRYEWFPDPAQALVASGLSE